MAALTADHPDAIRAALTWLAEDHGYRLMDWMQDVQTMGHVVRFVSWVGPVKIVRVKIPWNPDMPDLLATVTIRLKLGC